MYDLATSNRGDIDR